MRSKFDEELALLNVDLIEMGALCEEAIAAAIQNLFDDEAEISPPDSDVTRNIIRNEKMFADKVSAIENEINQKERDIESLCMKMILRQQPVARDLRTISSALKMITDMERIGDQAADIAEITKYVGSSNVINKVHIKDMANAAIKMLTNSVESFVKKDRDLACEVIKQDDIVDQFFDLVKKDLITIIRDDVIEGEQAIDILMIAKYLERIGDHAVNISEWVIYSITGKHKYKYKPT